jgi:type IV pilus assembly protein PilF
MIVAGCATQPTSNGGSSSHQGVSQNQDAAELNIQLGANYIANGEYQLADDKLKKAFKQDPQSSVARWTYAILQEKLNQPQAADHYYKEALRINPRDSRGQQNYASFLCRNGRYQEANKHFHKALSDPLFAKREATSLSAGVCAMEIPDYASAENYLQETLRLNSRNRVALYQLAKLHFKQDNFAKSQSYMRDFEDVSSHTAESLWLAYRTEKGLGNVRIAQSYAKLLTQQFPSSKEAKQLARVN